MTADFRAVHHHALEPFSDPEPWIQAHMRVAEKWEGRLPAVGSGAGTWEERALRAEAGARRGEGPRPQQRARLPSSRRRLEGALDELAGSISWRITEPLRRGLGAALLRSTRRPGPPLRARPQGRGRSMIALGCSISEPEPYVRYAQPGIRLAAEHDSAVFAFAAVGTVGRSYNLLLDAGGRPTPRDLEALVYRGTRIHAKIGGRESL